MRRKKGKSLKTAMQTREMQLSRDRFIEERYGSADEPEPDNDVQPSEQSGAWCDELDYVMRPDGVLEPVYGESPDDDAFGDGTDAPAEMESQPESLPPDESLINFAPPAYLAEPDRGRGIYGTLTYNARARVWTIRGEPCVVELAKRLFPGCDGRGRGTARFAAHARIIGDLNWLMLRYPLEIARSRPRTLAKGGNSRPRIRRAPRARRGVAPSRVTPPATFRGNLMPFQKLGAGFSPWGQPARTAGRRDGSGQDGSGIGAAMRQKRVPGDNHTAAAPRAQLGTRNCELCGASGRHAARTNRARHKAIRPARSRHIHRALPAPARLEEGIAQA